MPSSRRLDGIELSDSNEEPLPFGAVEDEDTEEM